MYIELVFTGQMKRLMPKGSQGFEIPDGTTLSEWYEIFSDRYADSLSPAVWNKKEKRFYRPVKVYINGERIRNEDNNIILKDQDIIKVSMILTGG